ncbi:hypothetical protein ACWFR1_19430 [Streptomyces sp. NPDC055103]
MTRGDGDRWQLSPTARALRTMTEGELDALGSALGALQSLNRNLHRPAH